MPNLVGFSMDLFGIHQAMAGAAARCGWSLATTSWPEIQEHSNSDKLKNLSSTFVMQPHPGLLMLSNLVGFSMDLLGIHQATAVAGDKSGWSLATTS